MPVWIFAAVVAALLAFVGFAIMLLIALLAARADHLGALKDLAAMKVHSVRTVQKVVADFVIRPDGGVLPDARSWNEGRPLVFYITDTTGQGLAGASLRLAPSGQEAVTGETGITGLLWSDIREQVTVECRGYGPVSVLLSEAQVARGFVHVELRRNGNGQGKS